MTVTAAAASLMKTAQDAGFTPYDMHLGYYTKSKMARFRMPSGNPIAIQIDTQVPRLWVLTKDVNAGLRSIGRLRNYSAEKSRSAHLEQVREFRNQPVTNIKVETTNPLTIRAIFSGSY